MKLSSKLFYILLAVVTVGELCLLAVFSVTHKFLFLYLGLALFPVYLLLFVLRFAVVGKREKKRQAAREAFLAAAKEPRAKVVYLTYLGGKRGIEKPSAAKENFLAELYTGEVDRELLKRHLWYGLSEGEEAALEAQRIGSAKLPYTALGEIAGKQVLVQSAFCDAARSSAAFSGFFKQNEVILYGN